MVQWSFRYYMILYRLNTLKKKNVRKANYEEPWPCLPKHPIGTGDPGRSSVWPLKGASIHRKEQPGHSTGGASSRSSHLSPLSPFLKVGLERWMPQLLPSRSQGLVASPRWCPHHVTSPLRRSTQGPTSASTINAALDSTPPRQAAQSKWLRWTKPGEGDPDLTESGLYRFEINMTSNMWRFP